MLAAAVACLGFALSAQAAHATYSKIQIVKINQGGNANDVFTFDTGLTPSPSPSSFTLKGGQASSVFSVECNASSDCTSRWGTLTQTVTERPAAGYTLTGVVCRSTTGSGTWGAAPRADHADRQGHHVRRGHQEDHVQARLVGADQVRGHQHA